MPLLKLTAATLSAVLLVGAGSVALCQSGDTLSVDVSVDEASARLAAAEDDVVELRGQLTELQLERSEFGRRLAHRPIQQQVPSLVESPHVYIVPLRVALTPSALRAAYVSGLPQLEQPGTITV